MAIAEFGRLLQRGRIGIAGLSIATALTGEAPNSGCPPERPPIMVDVNRAGAVNAVYKPQEVIPSGTIPSQDMTSFNNWQDRAHPDTKIEDGWVGFSRQNDDPTKPFDKEGCLQGAVADGTLLGEFHKVPPPVCVDVFTALERHGKFSNLAVNCEVPQVPIVPIPSDESLRDLM